jgi:molecular chaperone DnaK
MFNKKPNFEVNPDEAVAIGAAIQAGILSGDVSDMLLLDVTPFDLGIETRGNIFTPIIKANTTIPTAREEIFSTAEDNQNQVQINVLQGPRKMASDNKKLGTFILDGIEPAPRGIPQIEVIFDIDANGIVSVTAKDKKTNKEQHIVIQDSAVLSKEEVERMKGEAEKNKQSDEDKLKNAELINKAQSYLYDIDKAMQKIKPEEKESDQFKQIIALRDEISEAINTKNYEVLNQKMEALEAAFKTAMDAMYKAEAEELKNKQTNDAGTSKPEADYKKDNDASQNEESIEVDPDKKD